jgi:hypothetical protein
MKGSRGQLRVIARVPVRNGYLLYLPKGYRPCCSSSTAWENVAGTCPW